MSSQSHTTTNHEEIRRFVDERGGRPARVRSTGDGDDPGILRIAYPRQGGEPEELEEIPWDEWFEKFDENGLAFVYQEETSEGEESRFSKLVSR